MAEPEGQPRSPGDARQAGLSGPGEASQTDVTRRTRLANERTFLAWWRTGLTAFVVALSSGAIIPDVIGHSTPEWPYLVIGCGFAVIGVVCVTYGQWRQREVDHTVESGEWRSPSGWLILIVTLLGVALGACLILVFVLTA